MIERDNTHEIRTVACFAWRVTGGYLSGEGMIARNAAPDKVRVENIGKRHEKIERIILGTSPFGADVPSLYADAVLGRGADPNKWDLMIESMQMLGDATGEAIVAIAAASHA
jgi:hypothetical protein